MDKDFNYVKEKVRKELANQLGVEPEDIEDDSSLTEDLHMKASDITDFSESLANSGFVTSNLDFTEIETFIDLVEALTDRQ
jgi:acyl carrier protein